MVIKKNSNVCYEYERYVMEHIEEHYLNKFKHWRLLWKLNWHYRVKKSTQPMMYFDNIIDQNIAEQDIVEQNVSQVECMTTKEHAGVLPLSQQVPRTEAQFFARELLKYEVISFDIFDTLVYRALRKPEDVFVLVGEKLNMIDFSEIRKQAEKKIRNKNQAEYGNHEVTLEEIYCEIEKQTGLDSVLGMETELEIEYDLIYPNPYMKRVFDILREYKKVIIAVSDMYLSKEVIQGLLTKCGYSVNDLFVSSELHCSKRNGGLYKQVFAKYDKEKLVHIGDNHRSDIEKAKEMGLEAKYYRNCLYIGEEKFFLPEMSDLVRSLYFGLVNTTLYCGVNKFNPYFEYGYLYGGLYVLGFCSWIKEQAKKDGVEKILFLARDGDIYQKVFDMLEGDIESEYVYWSRIASVISNMEYNRDDFLKKLVEHKATSVHPTSLQDILNIIGISEKDINLKKYKLSKTTILCKENKEYFSKMLIDNYSKLCEVNKDRFLQTEKYLKSAIGECKKVAVIDVGWTGGCELSIKNLVEKKYSMNCQVYCYLAASKVKDNMSNIVYCMDETLKTYMFSQIKNREIYDYHHSANNGSNSIYLELFTQACSPSFKGISATGEFVFDVAEVENYEMIEDIHDGILYFAKQYLTYAKKYPVFLKIPGGDAYRPYQYISNNLPYIKKYFGDFSYARSIGGSGAVKLETIKEIMNVIKL